MLTRQNNYDDQSTLTGHSMHHSHITVISSTTPDDTMNKPSIPSQLPPTLRFPENSTVIPGDRIASVRQVQPGQGCFVRQGHIYATLVGKLLLSQKVTTKQQQVGDKEGDGEDEGEGDIGSGKEESKQEQKKKLVGKRPSPPFVCNVVPLTTTSTKRGASSSSSSSSAGLSTSSGTAAATATEIPTSAVTGTASSYVLKPGQLVLGRVVRITPQNAVVTIKAAENVGALWPQQLQQEGAIRTEDVRALASEQVQISESFQPGDLVAARVISLGDTRRYFLSTAETELGVIRASASQDGSLQQVMGSGSLQKRKREDRFLKPLSFKEMEDPVTGLKERRKVAKPLKIMF